jgi:hypothetical protein
MQHWIRKEKGNALIIGALSFAVLAAFGVLTIDVGRIFVTKTMLQNAADAGALAGASMYCNSGDPAVADVNNQVRLVGGAHMALGMNAAEPIVIPDGQIHITTPDPSTHVVEVETQITTRQYFLNLLKLAGGGNNGGTSDNVHAVAAAQCGATCGVQCIKPWSIPDRWDDSTPIAGHNGAVKSPGGNWQNNGKYDMEPFTDLNDNLAWDVGEPFTDTDGDGTWRASSITRT